MKIAGRIHFFKKWKIAIAILAEILYNKKK